MDKESTYTTTTNTTTTNKPHNDTLEATTVQTIHEQNILYEATKIDESVPSPLPGGGLLGTTASSTSTSYSIDATPATTPSLVELSSPPPLPYPSPVGLSKREATDSATQSTKNDTVVPVVVSSPLVPRINRSLVAIDGSEESEWAMNNAISQLDKEKDELYLLTVTQQRLNQEHVGKILLKFAQKAEKYGVQKLVLLLYLHRDVGPAICKAVTDLGINHLYLGHRRNASIISRWMSPSVTKHCLQEVNGCSVTVTQTPTILEPVPDIVVPLVGGHSEPIKTEIEKKYIVGGRVYPMKVLYMEP